MKHPIITIGITTYNAEESLLSAVDSALEQEWDNKEIIIVDDGSSDKTVSFLETLGQKHSDVRIFMQSENKGVATSRNKIIDESAGEFIAFFDDDDVSDPERLRKQYMRIVNYENQHANGSQVVCHTARMQIYPSGERRIENTVGTNKGVAPNGVALAQRILLGKPCKNGFGSMATCSQMARTSTYQKLGGFDGTLKRGEDTDFNIRLCLQGGHFVGIQETLVTQSMTSSADKTIDTERENVLKILEKHKRFIEENTSYDFCREWSIGRFSYLEGKKITFLKTLVELFFSYPFLTLKKIWWSFPNLAFNSHLKKFYKH